MINKSKAMLEVEAGIGMPVEDFLRKKYWGDRMTIKEIGKRINLGYSTVQSWMEKLNIRRGHKEVSKKYTKEDIKKFWMDFKNKNDYSNIYDIRDLILKIRAFHKFHLTDLSRTSGLSVNQIQRFVLYKKIEPKGNLVKILKCLGVPEEVYIEICPSLKEENFSYDAISDLGTLIRKTREMRKLTGLGLSSKTKIPIGNLYSYEHNAYKVPKDKLENIVNALDIPEEQIKRFVPFFRETLDYKKIADLGTLLKKTRELRKGWSASELAKIIGIDNSQINSYESNTVIPKRERLKLLIETLEIPRDEVLRFCPNFYEDTTKKSKIISLLKETDYTLSKIALLTKAGVPYVKRVQDESINKRLLDEKYKRMTGSGIIRKDYSELREEIILMLKSTNNNLKKIALKYGICWGTVKKIQNEAIETKQLGEKFKRLHGGIIREDSSEYIKELLKTTTLSIKKISQDTKVSQNFIYKIQKGLIVSGEMNETQRRERGKWYFDISPVIEKLKSTNLTLSKIARDFNIHMGKIEKIQDEAIEKGLLEERYRRTKLIKKIANYWKNLENIKKELEPIIKELGYFPYQKELVKLGKSGLVTAISRNYGGLENVRTVLGYPSKEQLKSSIEIQKGLEIYFRYREKCEAEGKIPPTLMSFFIHYTPENLKHASCKHPFKKYVNRYQKENKKLESRL